MYVCNNMQTKMYNVNCEVFSFKLSFNMPTLKYKFGILQNLNCIGKNHIRALLT
jgi:hypothetical protein